MSQDLHTYICIYKYILNIDLYKMFFKLMIKRIRKDAVWKLFETHATDPKFERSGVLLCFIAQKNGRRIHFLSMWDKWRGSQFPPMPSTSKSHIEKFVKLLERVSYITTALHLSLAPLCCRVIVERPRAELESTFGSSFQARAYPSFGEPSLSSSKLDSARLQP